MSNLVTIYGGSGFVGRYIARRMALQGWRVRVAVRHPNEAMYVKPYGTVGQVEPVLCNIRDDASVRAAAHGAAAVVNCVGTFDEKGVNNYDAVQIEGAARIARISAECGVARMVHISAIGADAASNVAYRRTKAGGEARVLEYQPDAVILRPSLIFGPEDGFFNRFANMALLTVILPVIGAATMFQPVYVDDVAGAAVRGVLGQVPGGVYELGGPERKSVRSLVRQMLAIIQRRRLVINIPFWVARLMAWVFGLVRSISLGLVGGPFTADQVRLLRHDSVVTDGARTLADMGIEATPLETVLPEYLWPYRPSGQYAAIKDSAKNLRV